MKGMVINMKKIKLYTVILLGIMLMGTLAGCESKDSEEIQENETAQTIETFDWYINFSWYKTPWGENIVSKAITEKTGVNINFITPKGNASEKFDALISSNTLPDIITLGWWERQLDEMIDKKMVYALNELADQYDAYFWKVADPTVVDWYTSEDGNIYCYPNSSYIPSDYDEYDCIGSNQTFLVRKDIYEAIGSPDMTTIKGFKGAVEKAARMFPEVDGETLIPVGCDAFTETGCVSFDKYLQNFLAIPFEKDGFYYDRYTDPDYIEWLKMFRELGSEGLLKEEIFIDQRSQMEEKISKGRYFCMLYQRTDMEAQQKTLYAKNPDMIYMAIDGPKNSAGDAHKLPGNGINGWTVTLISKNCDNPEKAIQFLSYLMSEEGQKMTYLGVEGVTYDVVNGEVVRNPEVEQLLNEDRNQYDQLYGADNAYWMLQDNVIQIQWKPDLKEPIGQLEEWTYPYTEYLGQYETQSEGNSVAGNAQVSIDKLWSVTLPNLLLAEDENEFDEIFADFVEQRDALDFESVKVDNLRQIKEANKKLGLN